MKTTEEWFNELNEAYKDKALKNMTDPKAEHYTLAGAVSNGFVWSETPEGKDYWNGVFREVMYGEKFETVLTIESKDSVIESVLVEVPKKKKSVKSQDTEEKSKNLFEDFKTQSLESK
jgi:hypothetical protein